MVHLSRQRRSDPPEHAAEETARHMTLRHPLDRTLGFINVPLLKLRGHIAAITVDQPRPGWRPALEGR
jgi:hypothetical protein